MNTVSEKKVNGGDPYDCVRVREARWQGVVFQSSHIGSRLAGWLAGLCSLDPWLYTHSVIESRSGGIRRGYC